MDELKKLSNPTALSIALGVQTLTTVSFSLTTWFLMYKLSPSGTLRQRYQIINKYYDKAESIIQRKVDKFPEHLKKSKIIDWNRLVTSGAEAWILRKPILPITYPMFVASGVYAGTSYYNWRFGININDEQQKEIILNEQYNSNKNKDDGMELHSFYEARKDDGLYEYKDMISRDKIMFDDDDESKIKWNK